LYSNTSNLSTGLTQCEGSDFICT